jgi:hypothetical protein
MPQPVAPLRILREAIKAVPAVKWALGVAGIASAVALVYSLRISPRVAVLGTVVTLLLMTVLVVFARLASLSKGALRSPAIVLTWFSLLLLMVVSALLVTCVFFRQPLDLSHWLNDRAAVDHRPAPPARPETYAVRVQILDPDDRPVAGSHIHTSVAHEPQQLADGWWQIEIPAARVPSDGMLTVWAEHEAWEGNRASLRLADDPNPQLAIHLKRPQTLLSGRVVDRTDHGVGGILVSPQDGTPGAAATDPSGRFELTLPVPRDTRVRLRAEGSGKDIGDAFCYAGRDTCQIVMEKR